jgi:hypothetical protein
MIRRRSKPQRYEIWLQLTLESRCYIGYDML